jgi:hypothetical protein
MHDGADGADAFSGLVAYARAWGVKPKIASVASAASGPSRLMSEPSSSRGIAAVRFWRSLRQ